MTSNILHYYNWSFENVSLKTSDTSTSPNRKAETVRMENVPEYQKAEFNRFLEDHQMKESLRLYNFLVESCFQKCVKTGFGGGFRSKNLEEGESTCVTGCAEKYMKLTQRVGFRLGEYQAIKAQQQQQQQP